MKTLLALLSLFVTHFSFSSDLEEFSLPYVVDSVKKDNSLNSKESGFLFTFYNLSVENQNRYIHFAYNGINKTLTINSKNQCRINLPSGKYVLQFYYSGNYTEITTDSISINSQYRAYMSLYWTYSTGNYTIEKPVIYLYPETPMLVEVKVEPKGELTFTYPEYNDGWKVLADPNGDLSIEGNSYNYLFWESNQAQLALLMNYENGFIVKKENTLQFLEEKLDEFGLNSEEKTDFITYWGPQLMKNSKNYVHFVLNSECDGFAQLNITPKPAHVYRIYLLFTKLSEGENLEVVAQEIDKIDRSGFTVIEWGGTSIVRPTKSFYTE